MRASGGSVPLRLCLERLLPLGVLLLPMGRATTARSTSLLFFLNKVYSVDMRYLIQVKE
jgi:hypothetical protein